MWSWHLWIAQPDVLNTTEVTNYQGQKFYFIQEPLGYKQTSWKGSEKPREVMVKVEQTYGPSSGKKSATIKIYQSYGAKREAIATYYQFGRKDAFNGLIGNAGKVEFLTAPSLIADCIQNPDMLYPYEYTIGGETSKVNLWSMEYVDYKDADHSVKTIYDPCPAGFKIPEKKAFTGFTTTGKKSNDQKEFNVTGSYNKGWNFNNKLENHDATVFFPALGSRERTTTLQNFSSGYYWTATSYTSNGYCLFLGGNRINPEYESTKCNTQTVFPVAE